MIATGHFDPPFSVARPAAGRTAGAQQGALIGATILGYPSMVFPPAALVLMPVGALIGAPIGALAATPAPDTSAAEAALITAQRDLAPRLHPMLSEHLVAGAQERAGRMLSVLPEGGPSMALERVDYRRLAAQGITTVLEVRIVGFGLIGQQSTPPVVSSVLGTRARLIRTSNGTTLYESTFGYLGPARALEEWAVDDAAAFREQVEAAVGWVAEQVIDQVFLRPTPVFRGALHVKAKPMTFDDLGRRLGGPDGLLHGGQRFEAEFEGVALQSAEGPRILALLPEIAHAPRDSKLRLKGSIDGAPFKVALGKDDDGLVNGELEGLVFGDPGEARAFVESFATAGRVDELQVDGYAAGRRLRVTLKRARVTVADRGAGIPTHRIETWKPDDALEIDLLPATLEDVREKLLGESGTVTREQRFDGEFAGLVLAVEDVEPLVALLRATLQARPESELDLKGTMEGLSLRAKLKIDRQGGAHVTLDGLVLASDQDVDRLFARLREALNLRELTVTGWVADRTFLRAWPTSGRPGPRT